MSDTRKDSARLATRKVIIEVIANGDDTFEIMLNQKLVGSHVPEQWLDDEVCGKYGFCGEEFEEIKRQLADSGCATLVVGDYLPPNRR